MKEGFIKFVSAVFVFLFTYTGASKLTEVDVFASTLTKSPLLSSFAGVLATTIPVLELLLVVFLILQRTRTLALGLSALLMAVFTIYIAVMMVSLPELPCSCGGIVKELSWMQHLILNIFLTLMATLAFALARKDKDFIAVNRKSRIPV